MRVEFNQQGTFQALYAAQAWCEEHGISYGQSCAGGPTGLLFGHWDWIAKWRNLTVKERAALHGTIEGDMREGPVVIVLKDAAVAAFGASLASAVPLSAPVPSRSGQA
ncbi:hypothetical protein [Duganella vulcania]|uniref:Uncharacterized protein n=1 Tax=Duganella vulcania TaxID=2692166 RepID=A0A845GGR3_9BURK|nr:hypothetical protein [Duganella vulcania]MYM92446.1 hypothetical protein [Duganella vulcania]